MISPEQVCAIVRDHAVYLKHNAELIDILEGNLLPYIETDLKKDMSPQTFAQAQSRIVPINMLPKITDKLTNIYQTGVIREVVDGTDADKELLSWYEENMQINQKMNTANEMYNLCKAQNVHPFVHEGKPCLRVVFNDKFIPFSDDLVMPERPTGMIVLAGKIEGRDIYHVYDDDEFYIYDSDGKVRTDLMLQYNNDGLNPIGKLPFVYAVDSRCERLIPVQDTDIMKMVKVIPIMLTDLNFAAKFQCFSIIYGINLDDEGLIFSPNAVWKFKTDGTENQKPELGTIKPTVDYDQALKLIESELSMWLGTKGIRPGSVGQLTQDNIASGISKIIDEMDTYEARQSQVTVYTCVEEELWDLILNVLHPYWVSQGLIENRQLWSSSKAKVKTTFAVQLPMQSRGQVVTDLKNEVAAGFITRKGAIMKLNPQMTQDQVEELMEEIDEERGIRSEPEEMQDGTAESGDQNPGDLQAEAATA